MGHQPQAQMQELLLTCGEELRHTCSWDTHQDPHHGDMGQGQDLSAHLMLLDHQRLPRAAEMKCVA